MPLFLMPVLQLFGLGPATTGASGWDAANVSALATARISNSCSSDCFKPWSIADRWNDVNGNGQFDVGIDQYNPNPPPLPGTGYGYPADNGLQVTLKVGTPADALTPGFFYAVDFPPINRGTPVTGGNSYRDNISTCGPGSYLEPGDQLQVEPGNKMGPTILGTQALIDLDPNASWDASTKTVVNSAFGSTSPRLVRIGFFDPRLPVVSGRTYVTIIKVGGFFIEGAQAGGNIVGYYTQVIALGGPPDPNCAFLQTVQMVK